MVVLAANASYSTGSSTIVTLLIDKNKKKAYSALIGDSLYLQARFQNSKFYLVFKSDDQSHGFNFPFQIGTQSDDPNVAVTQTHNIEDNDVFIVASDGLWDNLYDKDIMAILNSNHENGKLKDLKKVADELSLLAEKLGWDQYYFSPFSSKANDMGYYFNGGKADDVTVVVAQFDSSTNEKKEIGPRSKDEITKIN